MASKYGAAMTALEPLPVSDQSYQDKVEAMKLLFMENPEFQLTPSNLAKEYSKYRKAKDAAEEEVSACNLMIEMLSQMLAATQEANNPEWGAYGASDNTLRLVTGDKIEVRKEPYAVVEDKDANREWAIKNGLERMLGLPWQTINSIAKQRLLVGEAEPDGVKTFVKTKIIYTKMKAQ